MYMNQLLLTVNKKGFATLIPLVILSTFAFSLVMSLQYRMRNLDYSVSRYEHFLSEKYQKQSCANLKDLYTSFDSLYQSSQENSESKLIGC